MHKHTHPEERASAHASATHANTRALGAWQRCACPGGRPPRSTHYFVCVNLRPRLNLRSRRA
eukprot:2662696-Alexandrium_andersonii.AAC.1